MTDTQSRRRFLRSAGVASAAATTMVAAPAVLRAQEPIRWRCQSMWSAAELSYTAFVDLCARIGEASGGRLEIEPFSAGAVTGVFETMDAVSSGLLHAHSSWPGYFSGRDAGLAVLSDFVFGYDHPYQYDAWFYYRGGLEMLRDVYAQYNAYPVGISWWGVETMVSKRPIETLADFQGLNIRSPQGMTAEIFTKLGASIVVLPGGEVFSALDKGVVDAADWASVSMNERMGFHDIAPHPTKTFHSMPAQEFTVNLDEWNRLPEDLKQIVLSTSREWGWDQVQRIMVDDIRVEKLLREKGITVNVWDGDDLKALRDLARVTWEDWSQKTPLAKAAYDSHLSWLQDLGVVA